MKVIVTTSFSILAVDCESGVRFPIHRGSGLYYGAVKDRDRLIVAARRRSIDSGVPIAAEHGCLLSIAFDGGVRPIEAPFPLRDLHGLAMDGERILATCSFDEQIAIWDGVRWTHWLPMGEPPLRNDDQHHINTICLRPDGAYVLCHNFGASEIVRFDYGTQEPTWRARIGVGAHDIWFDAGAIRTCSSSEGKLVGLDGFSLATGGFPRGYSSDGNLRVVGVSAVAERSARGRLDGFLLVMDAAYRTIRTIELPGEGMILATLPVTQAEYARLELAYATSLVAHAERRSVGSHKRGSRTGPHRSTTR